MGPAEPASGAVPGGDSTTSADAPPPEPPGGLCSSGVGGEAGASWTGSGVGVATTTGCSTATCPRLSSSAGVTYAAAGSAVPPTAIAPTTAADRNVRMVRVIVSRFSRGRRRSLRPAAPMDGLCADFLRLSSAPLRWTQRRPAPPGQARSAQTRSDSLVVRLLLTPRAHMGVTCGNNLGPKGTTSIGPKGTTSIVPSPRHPAQGRTRRIRQRSPDRVSQA